ncbi:ABC transporter [Streptomyces sp. NPDC057757]|uniref:ABC transporter n=1 Tax=Streptomyces sp. NPDC057757 TaxID=3346241 RepID=UPI0036BF2DEB
MSTLTSTRIPAGTEPVRRGPRLSGLNWLVWHQHRAAFWTLIALTVLAVGWMTYQRGQLTDQLESIAGWPHPKADDWDMKVDSGWLTWTGAALGFIPVVVGVFLGAPLVAGDLENGTAKLVASQSVSRVRWLATKLGITALVVVPLTVVLSLVFDWWWQPVKDRPTVLDWTSGTGFDTTGPVPVALTLFTLVGGVAIGMLLRRTLLSMVVTLGFAVAVQLVWSYIRLDLADIVTVTTRNGVGNEDDFPRLPGSAYAVDQSYLTANGDLIGWGSCAEATQKATDACLKDKQVIGWSVDYIPFSQMSSMQWFGASVLFALTAATTVFILFWGRRRLV